MTHANDFQVRCATPADAATIIGFQLQMAQESEGLALDRDTLEKGVTAALSDPAREIARREGIWQIRLYVDKTNAAGISTYKALGMRESHYLMFEETV